MLDLFRHAGWVAWPLGFYSVLGLGIILERIFTLARLRRSEERAFTILLRALETGDESVLHDPQVAGAPVSDVLKALTDLRGGGAEALDRAAEVAIAVKRLRLRRYLGTLATIGSTAPVIGVLVAFQTMSRSGQSGEAMAAGISEALSATALGLLVAIPSFIAYNMLLGRIQPLLLTVQGHVARLMPLLLAPPSARAAVSGALTEKPPNDARRKPPQNQRAGEAVPASLRMKDKG